MLDQSERLRIRKNTRFHLVHHVRKSQSIFRVEETDATSRPWLTEACKRSTEDFANLLSIAYWILHETESESGLDFKDFIRTGALLLRDALCRIRTEDPSGTKRLIEISQ